MRKYFNFYAESIWDTSTSSSYITSHHEDLVGVVGLQEVDHARARQCLHLSLLRLLVALLQDMATLKERREGTLLTQSKPLYEDTAYKVNPVIKLQYLAKPQSAP